MFSSELISMTISWKANSGSLIYFGSFNWHAATRTPPMCRWHCLTGQACAVSSQPCLLNRIFVPGGACLGAANGPTEYLSLENWWPPTLSSDRGHPTFCLWCYVNRLQWPVCFLLLFSVLCHLDWFIETIPMQSTMNNITHSLIPKTRIRQSSVKIIYQGLCYSMVELVQVSVDHDVLLF